MKEEIIKKKIENKKKIYIRLSIRYGYWLIGFMIFSFLLSHIFVKGSELISGAINSMLEGQETDIRYMLGVTACFVILSMVFAFLKKVCGETYSIYIQRESKNLVAGCIDNMEYGYIGKEAGALITKLTYDVDKICIAAGFMYIYNNEAKKGAMEVKKRVFEKSMKLPMRYYDTHHSGDLISRLVFDTDKASDIYTSRLRRVVAPVVSVAVYVVIMLWMNPAMTGILIVLNIVLLLINTFLAKPMKKIGSQTAGKNSAMTQKLTNMLMGAELSKMNDYNHTTRKEYERANDAFVKLQKKKMYVGGVSESFFTGFDMLCGLMFVVVGLFFLGKSWASLGELAAIYAMYGVMSNQFLQLGKYYPELVNCIAFAERIFEFLAKEEEREEPPEAAGEWREGAGSAEYAIEMERVSFQYRPNQNVLNQFRMTVPRQKHVVLTGKSGCGKSTIAKLLLGLYQSSGERGRE